MVSTTPCAMAMANVVSVLALSSRFDGRQASDVSVSAMDSFSTRSVESF